VSYEDPSMPRAPYVPEQLVKGPFHLSDARRLGLSKDQLHGKSWRRLGGGFYGWRQISDGPVIKLTAVQQRIPGGVLSGKTAAWLRGLDLDPTDPVEVTVGADAKVSRLTGCLIHRSRLEPSEISKCRGLSVTTPTRTFADLGRRQPLVQAVTALDQALHRRLLSKRALAGWTDAHPGFRGVARLRRAMELAEPASESVMETRLRLLLVLAGLPRRRAQTVLTSSDGVFLGRVDLCYPEQKLAIEYDGAAHRERLASDNQRQNRLVDAGYHLLRFTATDVLSSPASVVTLVRRQLNLKK
jgi:very-short-patch-repair endonuclease